MEPHLLVDGLGAARTRRSARRAFSLTWYRPSGGNSTCTPRRAACAAVVDAGADHDRELEALRAVDRHDAHGVVVGLGQHRLDDACAFGALQRRPREVVAQRAARGVAERAAPGRRRTARGARRRGTVRVIGADLEHASLAHDAVRAARSALPTSARRAASREEAHRLGHGMARRAATREAAPQIPSGRRARRGTRTGRRRRNRTSTTQRARPARARRSGRRSRAQAQQQLADLAAAVHERARLGAVRDAGVVERALEEVERRARRQQDADVAEAGRAPLARRRCRDLPPLVDRGAHRRRDARRFPRPQLVGVDRRVGAARRRAAARPVRAGAGARRRRARSTPAATPAWVGSVRLNTWLIQREDRRVRSGSCT